MKSDPSLLERRRHRLLNTLHTWLLAAGSLLLLAVTAYVFAGLAGIAYAIVFGAIGMAAARRASPQLVLSMYKAEPVTRAVFPLGLDIVEELSRRAELPTVPKLYAVPSKMLNAFAVGRREASAIAITDALARHLTPRELAGVLAHEISHIAHEDLRVMALADIVSRFTSFMSTVGIFSLAINALGLFGGYEAAVPWFAVLLLIAAPTIGSLLQLALSRTREFDADLGAAMLTGDPAALASALSKLERAQKSMWEGMVLPGGRVPAPSVLRSHPATAERIARLKAFSGEDFTLPPMPEPRASAIPRIRFHRLDGAHRLMLDDLAADGDQDGPACDGHVNRPTDGPRIRPMRGGVWW